jgi:hypothetical protein
MCIDPGGNGAILSAWGGGGPGPPSGEEDGQLASDSGDGMVNELDTTPRHPYAQSMYHCVYRVQ